MKLNYLIGDIVYIEHMILLYGCLHQFKLFSRVSVFAFPMTH